MFDFSTIGSAMASFYADVEATRRDEAELPWEKQEALRKTRWFNKKTRREYETAERRHREKIRAIRSVGFFDSDSELWWY